MPATKLVSHVQFCSYYSQAILQAYVLTTDL